MTLAGGVLAWHINGQRAAEVRGVPSGVHFGVGVSLSRGMFGGGGSVDVVEVRIERAAVAGAAGCRAMLRPLCGLMGREGNALRTGCGWAATARGPRATARRSRRRWARRRAWWRSSTWAGVAWARTRRSRPSRRFARADAVQQSDRRHLFSDFSALVTRAASQKRCALRPALGRTPSYPSLGNLSRHASYATFPKTFPHSSPHSFHNPPANLRRALNAAPVSIATATASASRRGAYLGRPTATTCLPDAPATWACPNCLRPRSRRPHSPLRPRRGRVQFLQHT